LFAGFPAGFFAMGFFTAGFAAGFFAAGEGFFAGFAAAFVATGFVAGFGAGLADLAAGFAGFADAAAGFVAGVDVFAEVGFDSGVDGFAGAGCAIAAGFAPGLAAGAGAVDLAAFVSALVGGGVLMRVALSAVGASGLPHASSIAFAEDAGFGFGVMVGFDDSGSTASGAGISGAPEDGGRDRFAVISADPFGASIGAGLRGCAGVMPGDVLERARFLGSGWTWIKRIGRFESASLSMTCSAVSCFGTAR
jgi:hypothetical protein